jgi:hypothetical protein
MNMNNTSLLLKNVMLSILPSAFLFVGQADAQERPGKSPEYVARIAEQQRVRDEDNYARALNAARQKNWPLTIRGRDARVAVLVGLDEKGIPMYAESHSNVVAATTIGTNKIWTGGSSGLNLSGNIAALKNRLGIWDGGGINLSHVEFGNRITMKDSNPTEDGHATHVAGTLIASGVSPVSRGMAFGIQGLIGYNFNSHVSEMLSESPNLYASNHSYGAIAGWRYNNDQSRWEWWGQEGQFEDYKFGYYSTETMMWDSISFMSPNYLIVKSAGNNRNQRGPDVGQGYWRLNSSGTMINAGTRPDGISNQDGYDLLPTYSTAKNILSVGNVLPLPSGYVKPADVVLNNSSSVGPTDDGRIKPDVVANGTTVTSTSTGSTTAYATLSGTSMSSPTVAGSSILLQELYIRKFETPAWSSTIRGAVIHTAEEAGTTPGPDYQFGWGLANFERAAQVIDKTNENVIQQRTLGNGASYSFTVVASGKTPLKASITWTDPPGNVNPNLPVNDRETKLIHDLDIRIKRGARTFLPWRLEANNPTFAAIRSDNSVDNVEVVEIDSTIAGETYTIEVTHKGTLTRTGSQAYSLIVSGVGGKAYAASGPTSNAGSRIDSLSFAGIQLQNTTGCKTYTDNRSVIGSVEVGTTAPLFLRVNSCDASNDTKFAKAFIDFNSDGDFDDAGETVATSGALSNNGTFTTTVTVPNNLVPGTRVIMRLVLQETAAAGNVNPAGGYTRGETQDYMLQIANPSNDLAAAEVLYPQSGECGTASKYVTVRIRNLGSQPKANVPVTVEVRKGTTLVATLVDTCRLAIMGLSDISYTLQKPFAFDGGSNYSFTTRVNVADDQLPSNNVVTSEVTTSSPSSLPGNLEGVICNNTGALLKATTGGGTDARLSWYTTPTEKNPFFVGTSGTVVNTPTVTANRKYYVAANDVSGTVGPETKMAFPSGGYNEFNGNFVRFSNTVPMLIESTRMYIGNPGTITIILADIASENGTGGYSYFPISTRTFTVTNTRPTAAGGSLSENNPADLGAVFNLNFQVPTGNHILIMQATGGATVYRNNNIATNPYPQRLNGNSDLFTITGNSVVAPSDPNQFYYFFYDTKVSTLAGCPSPRAEITATASPVPSITQTGNLLKSSVATGNQWQLNNIDIQGANKDTLTAQQSGKYKSVVTGALGCVSPSNEIDLVITALNNLNPATIGLSVTPNPNKGEFQLRFRVKGRETLDIGLTNVNGQQVYSKSYSRFSGEFNERVSLPGLAPGVYMLQIAHGKDRYVKQMIVNR